MQATMPEPLSSRIIVNERFRSAKWTLFKWSALTFFKSVSRLNAAHLATIAARQRRKLAAFAMKYLLLKLQGRANKGHNYASIMMRSSPTSGFKIIFEGSEEVYDLCADTKIGFSEELDGRLKADMVAQLKDLGYVVTLSEPWIESRWYNDVAQHFHISWQ